MTLIPWSRGEANLFKFMDNLENDFWKSNISGSAQFRCDISDKGDSYLLEAELPGFEKKDINIEIEGDTLCISAKSNAENEIKESGYIRRERRYGSFSRSFDISGVDTEKINADYSNGVLKLTLPKQQETKPSSRTIEIQ